MNRMIFAMIGVTLLAASAHVALADDGAQYYEVRSYLLSDGSDTDAIDSYLRDAYLPALGRLGIGPIGVLTNSPNDQSRSSRIVVMIPYDSPQKVAFDNISRCRYPHAGCDCGESSRWTTVP